jgi:hypothetical protein
MHGVSRVETMKLASQVTLKIQSQTERHKYQQEHMRLTVLYSLDGMAVSNAFAQ